MHEENLLYSIYATSIRNILADDSFLFQQLSNAPSTLCTGSFTSIVDAALDSSNVLAC